MPYITEANARRMVERVNIEAATAPDDPIWYYAIYFLSKFEVRSLQVALDIYKRGGTPGATDDYRYRQVVNEDTLTKVFESDYKSAYHAKTDCIKLTSIYEDIKIPEDLLERWKVEAEHAAIKARNSDSTDKEVYEYKFLKAKVFGFRKWFIKHYVKDETDQTEFIDLLNKTWDLRIDTLDEIVATNSGSKHQENINLRQLAKEIDDLIIQAGNHFKGTKLDRPVYEWAKRSYARRKEEPFRSWLFGVDEAVLRQGLEILDERYKFPVMKKLKLYYQLRFNPHLKFEASLLEELNFVRCKTCG